MAQPPRELAEGARGQEDEREGDEREQNLPLGDAVHQGGWLLGAGAGPDMASGALSASERALRSQGGARHFFRRYPDGLAIGLFSGPWIRSSRADNGLVRWIESHPRQTAPARELYREGMRFGKRYPRELSSFGGLQDDVE
ncbi:uncharacterized protein SOCE836_052550 [Sorangium cellulosum]|uniref:Uncharacterized protein n=1 Tax=Sorangium cellulosum TaxID=56 RepID=A0A4V0NGG6_SORCE|nr:uncharacterized protein SOCE836_052550 [Sorangium cellulosum]